MPVMAMEVSSATLRDIEFRLELRGYNKDDVDEFLERVAAGIELLQDRIRESAGRATQAEGELSQAQSRLSDTRFQPPPRPAEPEVDDHSITRTLLLAQRTADLAVSEAHQQATEAMSRARADAGAMVAQAEEQVRRMTEEATVEMRSHIDRLVGTRAALQEDVDNLQRYLAAERTRVEAGFAEALRWVEENLPSLSPRPDMRHPNSRPAPPGSAPAQRSDADRSSPS